MTYFPALDGLRALAVVAVMAYHTGWFPLGYHGVTLFFILSGFLITRLLVREHDRHGTISLRHFYVRRALRLLPALVPLLVLVGGGMLLAEPTWRQLAFVLSVASYVGNYAILWHGQVSPLDHAWSLAVEEQFYLIWPVVLLGLLRVSRRWLVAGLLVTAGIGLAFRIASGGQYVLLAHPLFLGCVLGFLPTWRLAGLTWPLRCPPLTWIGRRSYGLYLWHFPVLYAMGAPMYGRRITLPVALLAWAIIGALATLSFRYLEQPALLVKARYA